MFYLFSVHTILIPILTTRKDGKLYAQFWGQTDGVNGEMFNLILNLVGFDNSFSEEKKSVWVTSMTFLRDFWQKPNKTQTFVCFFNNVIKQTLFAVPLHISWKASNLLIVWKNSVRPSGWGGLILKN